MFQSGLHGTMAGAGFFAERKNLKEISDKELKNQES